MHLTRFTDLSLRVLMYLTHQERKGLVTVAELSERFLWSRNHIVKVVHFMSSEGWLITQRGRLGGISLRKPPSEYRLGDLVRALEEQKELISCDAPTCPIAGGCQMRAILNDALEAFYEKLNTETLESITKKGDMPKLIAELNDVPPAVWIQPSTSSTLIRNMDLRRRTPRKTKEAQT